jgi:hypothetical protein
MLDNEMIARGCKRLPESENRRLSDAVIFAISAHMFVSLHWPFMVSGKGPGFPHGGSPGAFLALDFGIR